MQKEITLKTKLSIFGAAGLGFCGVLLETAMNVTFPTLMQQFGVSLNVVQWVTTAYLLAVAGTMLVAGFAQQAFKSRHILVAALGLFIIGGLICAGAPNLTMLMVGRLVQGISTGLGMPLVFATIMNRIPLAIQGQYMGTAGLLIALAPSLGPSYGGLINQTLNWRAIFLIVMPIGLIAGLVGILAMPKAQTTRKMRFPVLQFGLLLIALVGLILGFNSIGTKGLASVWTWGSLLAGVAALGGYIQMARRSPRPLIDLQIFKNGQFDLAIILYFSVQFVQLGQTFLLPQLAQLVLHRGSFAAGAMLLTGSLVAAFLSPIAGRLLDQYGVRLVALVGCSCVVVATVGMSFLVNGHLTSLLIIGGYLLYMIGFSFVFNNVLTYGLQQLPQKLLGDGNAAFNTLQQYAGSMGTAVVSAILAVSTAQNNTTATILRGGQIAYWLLAIIGLILFLLSLRLKKRTH